MEIKEMNNTYKCESVRLCRFLYSLGFDKESRFDENNNYIKIYKTIYEAENDSISNKSEIYRVASDDRKSSRNEKWKFTKTA